MVVASSIGSYMSYQIMPISGKRISETNLQHVTHDDMIKPDISVQIKAFDQALTERLYDTNFIIDDFNRFGVEDEGSNIPQC